MADKYKDTIYGRNPENGAGKIASDALKGSGYKKDINSETDTRVGTKVAKGK